MNRMHLTSLRTTLRATARPLFWLGSAVGALSLAACGGGSEPEKTYFAVQGTRGSAGLVATVCIDNAAYTDPASTSGQKIASTLATYYGISGAWRSYAGTGSNCRDRFSIVDQLLSVDEYNNTVVPAVQAAGGTPTPTPAPTPTPPPPPPPIACASASGSGTNGLKLYGQSSFALGSGQAGQNTTVALDPGEVAFQNPALSSAATTGSLRARLWAVQQSFAGGNITGYIIASYDIVFSDGSNQLRNGQSSNLPVHTLAARTPPTGAYCMVATLEQYDSGHCAAADHYCTADWVQFGASSSFR